MPVYFDDQPIVRGQDVIYRPAGNAGEYAPLATNPWTGCGHKCLYCYVPLATHIDRGLFNEGAVYRKGLTSCRSTAPHAYAATLTTLDDAFSRKWEPNAALPADRIEALKAFRRAGIFTWVSLEPTLDVEASIEIVRETCDFVDLYKIGKANYVKKVSEAIDWQDYTLRMIDLCQALGVKHYIKKDLQKYLPVGYHNPLRVPQHH